MAVPAYPYKVSVTVSGGKTVEIYLRGDEHLKYAMTTDGYTLLSDSSGWWYATLSDEGKVVKSHFQLRAEEDETQGLKAFKSACLKGIEPEGTQASTLGRIMSAGSTASGNPVVGERHALVILMQYSDLPFKKTRDDFESLFNAENYNYDGATGSVRDYYRFASQGQLDYISDIYGPYTANYPMRYYGGNGIDGGDANPLELCVEAVKHLPDSIDYDKYDNDGDGLVDNVHIIFAGYGEEAGATTDAIWSHEYPHRINLKNDVGFSLAGYSCSPELRGNFGSNISYIGVVCHELGHSLGAMDYYDTNYSTGGSYTGTGQWDIMASGSWNDNGRTPPNFNPYVRSKVFGWNKMVTLSADTTITMPRMDENNHDEAVIYKVETGSSDDYFLLENRQKFKFDAALPGAGLMVYHVHPDIDRYSVTNTINATHPQALYPVCAAYSEPRLKEYGNINSSECPFPGSGMVSQFSSVTSPAALAWNGSAATVALSRIAMLSTDGSLTFAVSKEATPSEPDTTSVDTDRHLVYKESFESGVGNFSITTNMGTTVWRQHNKNELILGADGIPSPIDGNSLLMLYVNKGSGFTESEATSGEIDVDAGDNYILSFDIYCKDITSVPLFEMYIENQYGEYKVYTLNKTTDQWQTVEIPLAFSEDKFKYKLYGEMTSAGGLFIDDIKLYKEGKITKITSLNGVQELSGQALLYSLDGRCVGSFGDMRSRLKAGIYIVRNGNRMAKLFIRH